MDKDITVGSIVEILDRATRFKICKEGTGCIVYASDSNSNDIYFDKLQLLRATGIRVEEQDELIIYIPNISNAVINENV